MVVTEDPVLEGMQACLHVFGHVGQVAIVALPFTFLHLRLRKLWKTVILYSQSSLDY